MKSLKQNFSMCLACAFVTTVIISTTVLGWLVVFDRPYLTYNNLPFPTLLQQVRAGEVIPLRVERCNSDDVPHTYNTTHSVEEIDKHTYTDMPDVRILISPGCTSSTNLVNRLPPNLPPGRYRVFGTAEVQGVIRMHNVEWHSQPFQVVP
jgi:hypothetical protein